MTLGLQDAQDQLDPPLYPGGGCPSQGPPATGRGKAPGEARASPDQLLQGILGTQEQEWEGKEDWRVEEPLELVTRRIEERGELVMARRNGCQVTHHGTCTLTVADASPITRMVILVAKASRQPPVNSSLVSRIQPAQETEGVNQPF